MGVVYYHPISWFEYRTKNGNLYSNTIEGLRQEVLAYFKIDICQILN